MAIDPLEPAPTEQLVHDPQDRQERNERERPEQESEHLESGTPALHDPGMPDHVISTVVKGELKALAYRFQWGPKNHARLDEMLAALPNADISPMPIIHAYAWNTFPSRT